MSANYKYLFALLLGGIGDALAQETENLIPNPSFEVWRPGALPTQLRVGQVADSWAEVVAGEIAYLHPKLAYLKPQQNPYGKQNPRTGSGMVVLKGFGAPRGNYGDDHRYYLQTRLVKPLVKGRRYDFAFWFSWSENSTVATDKIGAILLAEPISKAADLPNYRIYNKQLSSNGNALDQLVGITLQSVESQHGMVTTAGQWHEVKGSFIAQGSEEWLVIGTFGLARMVNYQLLPKRSFNWWDCYYFIDDVSLTEHPVVGPAVANQPLPEVPLDLSGLEQRLDSGGDWTLGDVMFDHNQAQLKPGAKTALNTLAKVLAPHPDWELTIEGHTDSSGGSSHNHQLSRRGVEAVADYLAIVGIPRARTHPRGWGAAQPLVPNTTPAQRRRNRRVQIKRRR